MRTLRTASAFELFDRLEQQLHQQKLSTERVPAAEIRDLGDAYEVLVDLPGIDRGSLEVNATDLNLSIKAQRHQEQPAAPDAEPASQPVILVSDYRYGTWSRSFRFPSTINRDQLQASYRDGVLRVKASKANTRTSVPVTILD
jgi:HSP20 family protein